ncbi:MAG TPA: PTS sugar transporter subunit IIA [Chloroflexi bacterium]|nr:PTS sugar transporter subunit IIA [Chloroflexota bacterium]
MLQADEVGLEGLALEENNILLRYRAADREDIIRKLGALLYEHGYVRDTFVQAVLDREKVFPTGLQARVAGFAIPHTDTGHVIKPALAIATLAEPVEFQAMGTEADTISVEIVMMLAVNNPKAVVTVLRSVVSLVENDQALRGILQASQPGEVKRIIEAHIQQMAEKYAAQSGNQAQLSH